MPFIYQFTLFLNTYMLNNVFTHLVNRLSDCSNGKSDICTQYLPYHKRHIVISGKLIEVKSYCNPAKTNAG